MKVIFVYNPHSGSALAVDELRAKSKSHGITVEKFIPIGDGFEKKLKSCAKKDQIIAAIGGDGTLSSVAGVLAGTEAIMAPLSGGTLNHFTKDLGISQDLDEALSNLTKSKAKKIDVASVNDSIFINNSSIGIYPSSLQTRDRFENHLGKWPAAVIGSMRAFFRYRSYEVTVSGKRLKTPFLFVGNNDYRFNTLNKTGRTKLDAGVLSVYTIVATNRFSLLPLIGQAIAGRLKDSEHIEVWRAKQVTIHTKRKTLAVSRDGELERLKTPLEYEIIAGSLRVIGSS